MVVAMMMAMLFVLKDDDGKEKIAMEMLMMIKMMMVGDDIANEVAYHSGAEAKYIFDLKQNIINFMHKAQVLNFEFIKSWSFQVICTPLFGD